MAPRRTSETSADESLDAAALNAVDEAARAIAGLLDLEEALQLIVERVRTLVGARYAALGIVGPDDRIQRFITSGMTLQERDAIGPDNAVVRSRVRSWCTTTTRSCDRCTSSSTPSAPSATA